MSIDKHNIEDIFSKKLKKHKVQPTEEEWIEIYSRLKLSNFLRFSFLSFNVYYLSVILVLAGTTTYTTFSNHKLNKEVSQLKNIIDSNSRSMKKDSVFSVKKPVMAISEKKEVIKDIKKETANEPETLKIDQKHDQEITKTTESTNIPVPQITEEKLPKKDSIKAPADTTVKIKKVKKTVLIKPQAVVMKDTVVVKKTESK